jgi:putative nucleotidyltransferase with HDIG domain
MPFLDNHPEVVVLRKLAAKRSLRLYGVGGFLRDMAVAAKEDSPAKDLDFAVSSGAIGLARAFARAIHGAFVVLDEEMGCARVVRQAEGEVKVFDFSDLRGKTLPADIRRRDFTVNALALDLLTFDGRKPLLPQVRDLCGAREDIRRKRVRMVAPGAFLDDPLRLLRAYVLKAQYGFSIERATLVRIKQDCARINTVAAERVREELFRILDTPRAGASFKAMSQSGLLLAIFPQMAGMRGVGKGGYHHLNVLEHSLCVLTELEELIAATAAADFELNGYLSETVAGGHSRRALLKLACLLHDVGKPDTRKEEPGGRVSYHGHERFGQRIVRAIARNLRISDRERYALEDMVALHLRPGYLANFSQASERMVFRFMRDARKEAVSILLLAIADQRATRGPLTTPERVAHLESILFPLVHRYFTDQREKPFICLLNGHDLIKDLQLKPGPDFARILREVAEAQHLGKITTKEEALLLAEKTVKVSGES